MLVLGIDTAAAGCGVAMLQDGQTLYHVHEPMTKGQDARLLPLALEVLRAAGKKPADLQRIAVLRGPGSFTGLRIGLAAARGLGLGLSIPVLGFDRLPLHHAALGGDGDVLVVLDSRRDTLFCQYFSATGNAEPFLALPASLDDYDRAGLRVMGDAAACRVWRQATIVPLPEPEVILAAKTAGMAAPEHYPPLPLYLRAPDVSCGPAPAVEEATW